MDTKKFLELLHSLFSKDYRVDISFVDITCMNAYHFCLIFDDYSFLTKDMIFDLDDKLFSSSMKYNFHLNVYDGKLHMELFLTPKLL